MCRSVAEGGQRCAAHLRPKFLATPADSPDWDDIAAQYASTADGHRYLTEQLIQARRAGQPGPQARLRTALAHGQAIREANAEAARLIHRAQQAHGTADVSLLPASDLRARYCRTAPDARGWETLAVAYARTHDGHPYLSDQLLQARRAGQPGPADRLRSILRTADRLGPTD